MKYLTNQEIFDKVSAHLLKQGETARTAGEGCKYRMETRGGRVLRCAVGCLISDENYLPGIEGLAIKDVRVGYPSVLAVSGLGPQTDGLLADLQEIHDRDHPDKWRASLRELARYHGFAFKEAAE